MRPPVRLAALMGVRVIYVFTHDSIGVGEDGPTHQPIEHIMALRGVPNLVTLRPADATETAEAWRVAMERSNGPTALVFSRQNLVVLDRSELAPANGAQRGAYVIRGADLTPDVILIATGSEVHIALGAAQKLQEQDVKANVVSMPSWELFDAQSADYRTQVLPPSVKARVSIEAGIPLGWERYVGTDGVIIGVPRFGASAPANTVYEKLGITVQHVVDESLKLL
jgi:transketolase